MAAKLSVNINKIATLRNSRGGNNPDLLQVAKDIQHWGADGITVHPRPDERHIRYEDVRQLKNIITTEFNVEGNPKEDKFMRLVLETKPTQVTLVPDAPGQLTSNHGWNAIKEKNYLREITEVLQREGMRVSLFMDPVEDMIKAASETGVERVELYTEAYAKAFHQNKERSIKEYIVAGKMAAECGLGLNAGHDLDLENLRYFATHIPNLLEVSIGHALVSDALYYGLQNVVQMYKRQLQQAG